MKKRMIYSALIVAMAFSHAQAADIIGGGDGAQTMHHCGYLPAEGRDYLSSPVTVRAIQQKLYQLGYYHLAIDGKFGPASRRAVGDFQFDSGLPETRLVDTTTISRLAYASHPSENVQRCFRQATNFFR